MSPLKIIALCLLFPTSSWGATLLSTLTKSGEDLTISKNQTVIIDQSVDIGNLQIDGTLLCDEKLPFAEIKTTSIHINGQLLCGSKEKPFKQRLVISLKDSTNKHCAYRGLNVNAGGNLTLIGHEAKTVWTRISQHARPGQHFVQVNHAAISSWQPGDQVILGSTSFDPREAEQLTITKVDINNKKVYFKEKLAHFHWGKQQTLTGKINGKVTLDERAEIANLTRNIVIRTDGKAVDGQGGHTMVMKGGKAFIDSVEFSDLGQAGQIARYPFHWHMAGDVTGQFIKNSSVHSSHQRCIVVHETDNALIENNVCYNFKGHGFFLETGNEVGNQFISNLGMSAKFPDASKTLLASESPSRELGGTNPIRFAAVATFWISNPRNTLINNVASGSVGTGFWMSYAKKVRRFNEQTNRYDGDVLATPNKENHSPYVNNVAHTTLVGHTWDGAPSLDEKDTPRGELINPLNPMDRRIHLRHYSPKETPTFKNVTAWKNRNTGIYFRGDTAFFEESLVADNGWSWFLAGNQVIKNSVAIGRSDNRSKSGWTKKQAGIVLYDGPFELHSVDFLEFQHESVVPMLAIGGIDKLSNMAKNVSFSPQPRHKLFVYDQLHQKDEWIDSNTTQHLIDVDGSLTGLKGAHIISAMVADARCKTDKHFSGFKICPPTAESVILQMQSNLNQTKIPFVVTRGSDVISLPENKWHLLKTPEDVYFQNKIRLLQDSTYTFSMKHNFRLAPGETLSLRVNADHLQLSPLVKLRQFGHCSFMHKKKFATLAELKSSREAGYMREGDDLWFKLSSDQTLAIKGRGPASLSQEHDSEWQELSCED